MKKRILVVCEGERTEPLYFKSFRVPRLDVRVHGAGANTVTVVEKAIELNERERFDETWCVFDRDSFPAQRFNEALALAARQGLHVAWSNEAFELWYLLHFDYVDAALARSSYAERLSARMGEEYRKNRRDMYDLLIGRQGAAIRNAKRLYAAYDPHRPADDNPCTTVHLLVERLRCSMDPASYTPRPGPGIRSTVQKRWVQVDFRRWCSRLI